MTDDIRPTVDEHGVKRCSPLCPNFRSRYHGADVTRARLVRECMLLQIEIPEGGICEPWAREVARLAKIEEAVENACKKLPEGWDIVVNLTLGKAYITLTDTAGTWVPYHSERNDDSPFANRINAAVSKAQDEARKRGE